MDPPRSRKGPAMAPPDTSTPATPYQRAAHREIRPSGSRRRWRSTTCCVVPDYSQVLPDDDGHAHAADARDLAQHPADLRRDGHRDRSGHGDRDGAARRHRRDPQEPRRSTSRPPQVRRVKKFESGHGGQSRHHPPRPDARRRARADDHATISAAFPWWSATPAASSAS